MTTPTTPMTADDVLSVIDDFAEDYRTYIPQFHAQNRKRFRRKLSELNEARTAVAAVYAERDALLSRVAELETGAARWQHARKLLTIDDIESAQQSLEAFGGLVSEDESRRADEAIDAARSKGGAS